MKKIFLLAFFILSSCTHSTLVKDCKPVVDDSRSVCSTMKPWE